MFHSYFDRKNDKVLTLNILRKKRLPLLSAARKFQNLMSAGGAYYRKYVSVLQQGCFEKPKLNERPPAFTPVNTVFLIK